MSPQAFSDLEPISKAAKRLRKHPRTLMRWTEKARRPAIHPAWARSVSPYSDNRRLAAYARQAKNRNLEADAVEIRLRATRKLDQLRQAQKETIGLSAGTRGSRVKGARVDDKPTLASQGIDKNLAQQARVLGKLSDEGFEKAVTKTRAKVTHRRARKRTKSGREATIEAKRQIVAAEKNKKEERALRRLGIEPAAIGEVAYKIIRADLQTARELYRILVAGGGDAACRLVRELAAGLENEFAADLAERAENAIVASPAAEPAEQPADVIEPDCDGELVWCSSES